MAHRSRRKPHILVAGLGNLLLQDDGVGIHAVHALQQEAPAGVCVAEIGTAVLDALHLLEWADFILAIDAMQAGGAPGTLYRFGMNDVAAPDIQTSLHELSLVSALRFLPAPKEVQITVLGVEPAIINYGLELSPAVNDALPALLHNARQIIAEWQRSSSAARKTKELSHV